jgi:hypothetical protein
MKRLCFVALALALANCTKDAAPPPVERPGPSFIQPLPVPPLDAGALEMFGCQTRDDCVLGPAAGSCVGPQCGGGTAYNRTFSAALAAQRAVACKGVQQKSAICKFFSSATAECVEQRCVTVEGPGNAY